MKMRSLRRYTPALAGGAVLLVLCAVAWYLLDGILGDDVPKAKKTVQQISLIQPPPPPPPPKVEQPPEPEIKEEVKLDEPPPVPDDNEPPPGEDLGVDADGGAGGDGFGLVGRKGGRDLMSGRFGWYGNLVQSDVLDALMRDERIRKSGYRVVARLWVGAGGEVQRFDLIESSGDADIDAAIKKAVASMGRIAEAPPADLPQPIKLRFTARM